MPRTRGLSFSAALWPLNNVEGCTTTATTNAFLSLKVTLCGCGYLTVQVLFVPKAHYSSLFAILDLLSNIKYLISRLTSTDRARHSWFASHTLPSPILGQSSANEEAKRLYRSGEWSWTALWVPPCWMAFVQLSFTVTYNKMNSLQDQITLNNDKWLCGVLNGKYLLTIDCMYINPFIKPYMYGTDLIFDISCFSTTCKCCHLHGITQTQLKSPHHCAQLDYLWALAHEVCDLQMWRRCCCPLQPPPLSRHRRLCIRPRQPHMHKEGKCDSCVLFCLRQGVLRWALLQTLEKYQTLFYISDSSRHFCVYCLCIKCVFGTTYC